jgi:hypothetical protein
MSVSNGKKLWHTLVLCVHQLPQAPLQRVSLNFTQEWIIQICVIFWAL